MSPQRRPHQRCGQPTVECIALDKGHDEASQTSGLLHGGAWQTLQRGAEPPFHGQVPKEALHTRRLDRRLQQRLAVGRTNPDPGELLLLVPVSSLRNVAHAGHRSSESEPASLCGPSTAENIWALCELIRAPPTGHWVAGPGIPRCEIFRTNFPWFRRALSLSHHWGWGANPPIPP